MVAAVQDARVIEWFILEISQVTTDDLPDGWEFVELIGGPFDGLQFPAPADADERPLLLTLPTTPADRTGGACYASYSLCCTDGFARFVGIGTITNM